MQQDRHSFLRNISPTFADASSHVSKLTYLARTLSANWRITTSPPASLSSFIHSLPSPSTVKIDRYGGGSTWQRLLRRHWTSPILAYNLLSSSSGPTCVVPFGSLKRKLTTREGLKGFLNQQIDCDCLAPGVLFCHGICQRLVVPSQVINRRSMSIFDSLKSGSGLQHNHARHEYEGGSADQGPLTHSPSGCP